MVYVDIWWYVGLRRSCYVLKAKRPRASRIDCRPVGHTSQAEGPENILDRLKARWGIPVMMKVLWVYQIDYRPVGHSVQTEGSVSMLFVVVMIMCYVGTLRELTMHWAYSFRLCLRYSSKVDLSSSPSFLITKSTCKISRTLSRWIRVLDRWNGKWRMKREWKIRS